MKKRALFLLLLLMGVVFIATTLPRNQPRPAHVPLAWAQKRDFAVEVKTIGELEAARSIIVASTIKGDLGKIVELIADGVNVQPGDILLKMDPTPFEEKIDKLKSQIKEQEAYLVTLQQTLEWEKNQIEHEEKIAAYEVEAAELELDKIKHGDGPQEMSRLKSAMQKAWLKYEELNGYSQDLLALEKEGFLNHVELKQAQKKLLEEQEAYDMAKLQYDDVNHVYPMQIKKAETHLKRALARQEEVAKTGLYKLAKAYGQFLQAEQTRDDYLVQLRDAKQELVQTEIVAPAPGMVVHREEFRSGQKRKPRVGDVLVKNQPLMDLPDLSSTVVKTRVREVDLYKVGIGKPATIAVDAYPELKFKGTVASLGVLALAEFGRSSDEKYFEVRVALDTSDLKLRPGMTARVTIHSQHVQDALSIPLHALFATATNHYCYIASTQGYEKREVKVGTHNEQWVEILAGLEEGQTICLLNPLTEDQHE